MCCTENMMSLLTSADPYTHLLSTGPVGWPWPRPVAQICNLLYRGFAIRSGWNFEPSRTGERSAECNSAIQQIANLRYGAGRREGYKQQGKAPSPPRFAGALHTWAN